MKVVIRARFKRKDNGETINMIVDTIEIRENNIHVRYYDEQRGKFVGQDFQSDEIISIELL